MGRRRRDGDLMTGPVNFGRPHHPPMQGAAHGSPGWGPPNPGAAWGGPFPGVPEGTSGGGAPWGPPAFRGVQPPGPYGPPSGWRPPTGGPGWGPRPPVRSSGLLAGCLIAVAVIIAIPALIVLAGAVMLPGSMFSEQPTPTPTAPITPQPTEPTPPPTPDQTPPPTPVPDPTPEPIPDRTFPPLPPPHSDDPAWVSVQQAPIYAVAFPDMSGCPPPALLATMSEMQPYAAQELQCIQDAWQPVLAGLGLPSTDIPHFYFDGSSATSACGTTKAPAFYCSANGGAIYFGEGLLQGTSVWATWAKDLVGHEYGHHLQAISGVFEAEYSLPAGNETARRREIQATCYGFGMMRRDDSIPRTRDFHDGLELQLRDYYDDGIHGTPDSLVYWGMRGFHGDLVGECNTWVVGSEMVE